MYRFSGSLSLCLALLLVSLVAVPPTGCSSRKYRKRKKKKRSGPSEKELARKASKHVAAGDKYRRMYIDDQSMRLYAEQSIKNYQKALRIYQELGDRYEKKDKDSPYDSRAARIQQNIHEMQKQMKF